MMSEHRIWLYGDHVNTDVIFPGKYTYTLREPAQIASKALEDLDANFAGQVREGDVIVAGANWGCGSSREQAVTALRYCGIRMIIAKSFNGLYFRNCINQGIRPVVLSQLSQIVQMGDTLQYDAVRDVIVANGQEFGLPTLPPSVQAILETGGLVAMLRSRLAQGAEVTQ